MQKLIKILLMSLLAILSTYSFQLSAETVSHKKQGSSASSDASKSSDSGSNEAKITAVKAKVKSAYPQITLDSVRVSPVKGWFEATAGNAVLYVSEDANYLFAGELLDLNLPEEERGLTEKVRRGLRLEMLKKINTKDMVVYPVKKGTVKKTSVIAFIDSDCTFCHKLHEEHEKLADAGIELQYIAFPRAGVGSPTYTHMVSAWCAENRIEAFNTLMKGGEIPAKECSNPIADQFLLGQKLGIAGTPTLFFEDGSMVPGYLQADKLAEEALKHIKPSSSEKK
jgi:thiol:disulfide interchange protein DsbC